MVLSLDESSASAADERHRMKLDGLLLAAAGILVSAGLLGVAVPAAAEPATTVSYPSNASATRFNGYAFDACTAPSAATMKAWTASPYDGVGVYVGGVNRSCAQPNLTSAWVSTVSLRAGDSFRSTSAIKPRAPEAELGEIHARARPRQTGRPMQPTPSAKAKALGMLPGSAIYGDMENYTTTDATLPNRRPDVRLGLDQGAAPTGLPVRHLRQLVSRSARNCPTRTAPRATPGRTRCGSRAGTAIRR